MKQIQSSLAVNVRLNDCEPSKRDRKRVVDAIKCDVEALRHSITSSGLKFTYEFDLNQGDGELVLN